MSVRTEVGFTLPVGVTGSDGEVHRDGVMRLATARDEIVPLASAEVRRNEAYLTVLLLARTVVSIGPVTDVDAAVIEELYAADFDHLQRLYERLNTDQEAVSAVCCPHCREDFEIDLRAIQDAPAPK
ncbi:MAG: hypothetical protein JWQ20_4084 [Conexibacter sp.]|nr:hypothetical protein [Solirubrobacterales bacterium]MCW3004786.1 hypothetical protein [Conexibacter sp.]